MCHKPCTEEEYRDSLQKGEEQDLEVLPVTQPTMEQRLSKHQVQDKLINKPMWDLGIDPRMPGQWNQVMVDIRGHLISYQIVNTIWS